MSDSYLWLAKTNTQLNDYSSAKLILNNLLNTPKLKNKIKDEAEYYLGELELRQENYEVAKEILAQVAYNLKNMMMQSRIFTMPCAKARTGASSLMQH